MLPDQIKGARLTLRLNQRDLAAKLGVKTLTVSKYERIKGSCTHAMTLAIRFLLVQAGMYAHFRMIYMHKRKIASVKHEHKKVGSTQRAVLIADALSFKYNV